MVYFLMIEVGYGYSSSINGSLSECCTLKGGIPQGTI